MPPNRDNHIDLRKDIFAILFFAMGMFIALALFSYSPTDPALNSVSNVPYVKNLGGIVGAYLSDILFVIFGVSAYLASAVFIFISVLQFLGRPIRMRLREVLCYGSAIAFAASIITLKFETLNIRGSEVASGGIIGELIGNNLERYLNRPGAYLISIAGFFLFFTIATRLTITDIVNGIKQIVLWTANHVWNGIKNTFETIKIKAPVLFAKIFSRKQSGSQETLANPKTSKQKNISSCDVIADAETEPTGPKILKRADAKLRRAGDEQLKFQKMSAEGYEPPPISLLDAPERKKVDIDEDTLKKNSMLVEKKLRDFEVEGKVVAIHPGPVITMYEFEPSAGTKVNKVVNLQDDLSLTLGGRSVRIVPHLPGKAALGIEIPNSEREIVWLKDTLSSPQYHKSTMHLPIGLGSSTSGHPVVADLTKMPHLLVAGATGSGKSVAINSIIVSILYKSSPADVRFILVDPKMLELSIYDGIPHLLLPVVTKPKPAVCAMRWAIREMERRYRLMADTGTRNILGYNDKIKSGQVELVTPEQVATLTAANPEAVTHTGNIPYIVIIIDELADLMMTSSQDMEECITRLAQMARAAGIHLILATQRPSVDVITGLIKANFPARIAFKVTAKHDSRTIIDGNGAETLLGQGDMLFMTPQGANLIRIHGSYITDADISRVVSHLKGQGEPVYDESILEESKSEGSAADAEEGEDELYDQALQLVAETKQASISMVQRRLRIGYNRAARLIERMESQGVVGPADGSKPRQVLANNL